MSNRNGPGRPNEYGPFVTSWGERIDGAYRGKDGKLRPFGRPRPAFSLKDELRAVHRFRKWQAQQETEDDFETVVRNPKERAVLRKMEAAGIPVGFDSRKRWQEEYRQYLRHLILSDPKRAAVELDVEHLAWHPKKPTKPQFTLAALADEYVQKKRNKQGHALDAKYRANLSAWWAQFLKITGDPPHARDLSRTKIDAYFHAVVDKQIKDSKTGKIRPVSPTYIKSRFSAVKAILQYGIDRTEDSEACRKARDFCAMLVSPPQKKNPTPISPEDLRALLDAAWLREKAMILLGLNLAMHGGEVASVRKDDIDLDARTYEADRNKTGIPRVGHLWLSTVEAIQAYQNAKPHSSEFLFASRTGKPLTGEAFRQKFVTIRARAGISEAVTFEGIRDGAYKAMFTVDAIHSRWVGGHASWTGQSSESKDITTAYVERDPLDPNVIRCCKAIEAHYFGGKK